MSARFLSWISHHGRSAAIASAAKVEATYLTGGSGPAPVRYVRAARDTRKMLRGDRRISHVILMLPPFPALLAVAGARRDVRIAGDLHSGVFNDPKWSWALKPTLAILRRRGIAIVTNEALARVCRNHGVETIVLHNILEDFEGDAPAVPLGLEPASYVLFPVTYAADEPIDAVLTAAAQMPEQTFVLTGRAPEAVRARAPRNVVFPGFVTRADFESLLRNAGAVAALTTREDTMQQAGYEAVSAGVPLIVSSTAVLLEYFEDSAVFTDATPAALERAVTDAMSHRADWQSRLAELKVRRTHEQASALQSLREWLER